MFYEDANTNDHLPYYCSHPELKYTLYFFKGIVVVTETEKIQLGLNKLRTR